MPNIKSAIKRVKVTETKNLQNRMVKSSVKTTIKKFDATVAAGDAAQIESQLRVASAAVDKEAHHAQECCQPQEGSVRARCCEGERVIIAFQVKNRFLIAEIGSFSI